MFLIIERVVRPGCGYVVWAGEVILASAQRLLRDRQRWARYIKGEIRVEDSVSEMSELSGVKSRASVCGRVVENDRATGKTFVRISDCIAAVRGLGVRLVQTCGGTVSEATAITELVVVEA